MYVHMIARIINLRAGERTRESEREKERARARESKGESERARGSERKQETEKENTWSDCIV